MVLITRPEHDLTTKYLSRWSELSLAEAKTRNIRVIDLWRNKASQVEVMGRLQKIKPKFVILNGHGNESVVTGHDNEVLVAAGENSESLRGRVTYAVSCKSAKELGQEVASFPETAYIGYEENFSFVCDDSKISRPTEDQRAKPFFESSNQVIVSLLKGRTCAQAVARSREVAQSHLDRYLASWADPDARFDAAYLWWNMKNQVCLGDSTLKACG